MADTQRKPDQKTVLLAKRKRTSGKELPAVEEFFRTLSQRVRARLVNRVGSNFQVRITKVSVQQIGEVFGEDMADGVFGMLRFDAPRIPGPAAMERGLLTGIIGAMLGDEGGLVDTAEEEEDRPLSIVEQRIAERIFMDLATDLTLVWPIHPSPPIVLDGSPGSSRVVETGSTDEDVYVGQLEFGPPEEPYGILYTTIPVQVLRGIEGKGGKQENEERRVISNLDRVMPIEFEVIAEFACMRMRVRELQDLKVGDVVPLGPTEGVLLRVNGKNVIKGDAGIQNGQRSIKVTERLS